MQMQSRFWRVVGLQPMTLSAELMTHSSIQKQGLNTQTDSTTNVIFYYSKIFKTTPNNKKKRFNQGRLQ